MVKTPIYTPKYGMTMTEAYIVEWLVSEGDHVDEGQPILTIETEKANTEIEAPATGFIGSMQYKADEYSPVGEILAYIVDEISELDSDEVKDDSEAIGEKQAPADKPETSDEKPKSAQLSGKRKHVAQAMINSLSSTAQYTITRDIDVSTLVAYKSGLSGISYNDLIIKALAITVSRHPSLKQQLLDGRLFIVDNVNIGYAVAVENGLVVPVIKQADRLSLQEIAKERKRLVELAKADALEAQDMVDGVCTLSNLGNYHIDAFTPVLNPPESIILGVGRILDRPWVDEGQVVVKPVMYLSLTADHQLIDGAVAAEALDTFSELITNPEALK